METLRNSLVELMLNELTNLQSSLDKMITYLVINISLIFRYVGVSMALVPNMPSSSSILKSTASL